jgi:chitinase
LQAHTSIVSWEPNIAQALWSLTPISTPTSSNVWKPNTVYKVGDIVTYNNKRYSCLQAHTSIVSWEPNIAQALWKLLV